MKTSGEFAEMASLTEFPELTLYETFQDLSTVAAHKRADEFAGVLSMLASPESVIS